MADNMEEQISPDAELEKKRKAEEEIERSATEAPIEPLQPASEAKVRAQRFLTVMNSEQIFQLMLDIAEQIPEALEKIEEKAQSDPAHRKLFIRGLAWETTDEQLKSAFLSYGEIEDAAVVMDRTMAGKNKGYGFVIFKDMDAAYAALQEPEKEIDGRKTHCNLASLGGQGTLLRGRSGSIGSPLPPAGAPPPEDDRSLEFRKLFLRGLDYTTTVDELRAIFGEYGEIEECAIPTERGSGKSKGFAFLTFKQTSAATDALHHPVREIGGRTVNVHLATQTNPHRSPLTLGGPGPLGPMPTPFGMGPPPGVGQGPGPQFGPPDSGFYGGGPRGGMPPPPGGRFW